MLKRYIILFIFISLLGNTAAAQVQKSLYQAVEAPAHLAKVTKYTTQTTTAQTAAKHAARAASSVKKTNATKNTEETSTFTFPHDFQVSMQLNQRVNASYRQAVRVTKRYPQTVELLETGPSKFISPKIKIGPKELYPTVDFLHNKGQLTNYFLAQQNRTLMTTAPLTDMWRRDVISHIPEFHQNKKSFNHLPQEDMAWLAKQVTPKTTYLLLGESHDCASIPIQVANLLHKLRQQYPKRPMVLLTEFLPNKKVWGRTVHNTPFTNYLPVWETSLKERIPVVGLDPHFVQNKNSSDLWYRRKPDDPLTFVGQNIWTSLEGKKIRNTQWLETLKYYQAHYPRETLFVVYGGASHILFNEPFSIGTTLAGPHTFIAALFPTRTDPDKNSSPLTSAFDKLTRGEFTSDRVLQFKDPHLSQIAGFHARLRIARPRNEKVNLASNGRN